MCLLHSSPLFAMIFDVKDTIEKRNTFLDDFIYDLSMITIFHLQHFQERICLLHSYITRAVDYILVNAGMRNCIPLSSAGLQYFVLNK